MSDSGEGFDLTLPEDEETELWGTLWGEDEPRSLVDLVNRVLDRGVVISGDVTISVAGVDLVYLQLHALLTSVSTARRMRRRPAGEAPGEE